MPSTPQGIGQLAGVARTDREDRGQRGNKWWTLVAVCLGTFMLLLDITIVNVALPDIQRALHSSFADLQWVVDAYALTLASFLLTAGSLADIYGRRVLYLIGLVVFTGASALCGFATSTLMLQLPENGHDNCLLLAKPGRRDPRPTPQYRPYPRHPGRGQKRHYSAADLARRVIVVPGSGQMAWIPRGRSCIRPAA